MERKYKNCEGLVRDNNGVAAIELAMIIPVLSFLLVGMVDYGMFINQRMHLQELSRRAAEYVVQGGQEGDVAVNVIQVSSLYTATPPITYTAETVCECSGGVPANCSSSCNGNDYMRSFYAVTISGTYTPILPYPGIESPVTLTGYSRLQYAR